jgi:hypothetical protein
VIADINVITVVTIEGRLDGRILTDPCQQLPQDSLSFIGSFAPVETPQQLPGLLAISFQLSIKAIVGFSG